MVADHVGENALFEIKGDHFRIYSMCVKSVVSFTWSVIALVETK